MIWLAIGIVIGCACIGYGMGEIAEAMKAGFELLAETAEDLD